MKDLYQDIPVFCKEYVAALDKALPDSDVEMKRFRDSIMVAARKLEMSQREAERARKNAPLDDEELLRYFRSRERNTVTAYVLEYMVSFLDGLPGDGCAKSEPANPFIQFRSMTAELISQMDATDVRAAVLEELGRQGRITESNSWYYIGRMDQISRKLRDSLGQVGEPTPTHWEIIFDVLSQFCRFWFCLRNGDSGRIRQSDAYIYQLTSLLCTRMQAQK